MKKQSSMRYALDYKENVKIVEVIEPPDPKRLFEGRFVICRCDRSLVYNYPGYLLSKVR